MLAEWPESEREPFVTRLSRFNDQLEASITRRQAELQQTP